jgi:surface polysaccharide O-acyltransferase-like enzyme
MSAVKESKYNPVIDLIRTIAILAVILIHSTTKILGFFQNDLLHHPLTLFLNQSSRFAVPLFFLISAFVLELNYPQNFNYLFYLKKRFSRLFLPYFFWSLIYYYFVYTYHSQNFVSALFLGTASYQLYFITALFIF